MCDEYFINGFCRALNQSRMVTLEVETEGQNGQGGQALSSFEADCGYGSCVHEGACEIAGKIEEIRSGLA